MELTIFFPRVFLHQRSVLQTLHQVIGCQRVNNHWAVGTIIIHAFRLGFTGFSQFRLFAGHSVWPVCHVQK